MRVMAYGKLALLVAFTGFFACSSDDSTGDNDGTGGQTAAGGNAGASGAGDQGGSTAGNSPTAGAAGAELPVMTACRDYCEAEDDCNLETTVANCVEYTCDSQNFDTRTAPCQDAMKLYYDCMSALSDPCTTTPCESVGSDAATACN
jgi:hypothetical protein